MESLKNKLKFYGMLLCFGLFLLLGAAAMSLILLLVRRKSSFPNEPSKGLNGIRWGKDLRKIKGMKMIKHGLFEWHNIKPLPFAWDIAFDSVYYHAIQKHFNNTFYSYSLCRITIYFSDEASFQKLYQALTERHGAPVQETGYGTSGETGCQSFSWKGRVIVIKLLYDSLNEGGYLSYIYLPALNS